MRPRCATLAFCVAGAVAGGRALAQPAVAPLPRFRATQVRVLNDTAWFFSERLAEGARRHPVIGFVPATGQWITALRRWRFVDSLSNLHSRSGPVATSPNETQAMEMGHGLVDGRTSCDADAVMRFALVRPDGRRVALRFDYGPSARRKLYREGGGHALPGRPAPSFNRTPALWAAADGRIALAYPGIGPPERWRSGRGSNRCTPTSRGDGTP